MPEQSTSGLSDSVTISVQRATPEGEAEDRQPTEQNLNEKDLDT
jgi:hypothetical protein